MKILRANKPEEGKTPIVIALSDLSNLKLRDHYNPETMNGRTKRYNTYLKASFDKEGMNSPIQITRVDNGRCKPYTKVPKGGNRCNTYGHHSH